MNWYYAEGGQQKGPVTEQEFESLVRAGTVRPETLVWREGLANWIPYSNLQAASAAAPGTVICSQCGKAVPADQVIRQGDLVICAECKPVYLQRLQEGTLPGGGGVAPTMRYAGFWIRFAAYFIDWILLNVVFLVIALAMGASIATALGGGVTPGTPLTPQQVAVLFARIGINLAIQVAYDVIMVGRLGATVGKLAVGIRIVRADGSPVGYGLAVGRFLGKIVSSCICLIGFIMAAFDDQKRALHDRICSTRVIFK